MPTCCPTSSGWNRAGAARATFTAARVRSRSRRHIIRSRPTSRWNRPRRTTACRCATITTAIESEGVSKIELFVGDGIRQSTATCYLHPAMARPNLTVKTNALTTRVLLEKGRAVGVEFIEDGKKQQVFADREVILSGGAYNSPQLLLLSGIGPADHLKSVGVPVLHDLPGVGQNLAEHPNMLLMYKAKNKDTFLNQLRLDRAVSPRRELAPVPQGRLHQQRFGRR